MAAEPVLQRYFRLPLVGVSIVESIGSDREPLSGGELARDTIAVLYSAYVSAERRGAELEIPV